MGYEAFARAQIVGNAGPQGVKLVSRERTVYRAPGNRRAGGRLVNDKTVHRRAAGTCTGLDYQSASICQLAFVALNGQLDQVCHAQVGVHGIGSLRHQTGSSSTLTECIYLKTD